MKKIVIALAGNPNSGKTTVFNNLTGARQKVGNWPGVTVEKKEGEFEYQGVKIKVVDLPGTYSLTAYSIDERIARDFLIKENPDVVVPIVDASNIERNLYLVAELLELGANVVVDLNMMDLVQGKGWEMDITGLSQVLSVPIVPTIANKKQGMELLKKTILEAARKGTSPLKIDYGKDIENAISELVQAIVQQKEAANKFAPRWLAIKLLEKDPQIADWLLNLAGEHKILNMAHEAATYLQKLLGEDLEVYLIERRYGFLSGLTREFVKKRAAIEERLSMSDRVDRVMLNRWFGIPIFLFFMWLTFKLVFTIGSPFADYIDSLFGWLGEVVKHLLGEGWLTSLVSDGIVSGVGSVLVFLPNIMILFLAIGFMEDSGYMARAAFVMDRFMHALGLHGKSFIPMVLGLGCNIPGIMATRTLESRKDRILTILINPFMSCSARLPIYVLFAGVFFPKHAGWVIFSMYVLGIVVAIATGRLFKSLFFKGEVAPLIMELPPYRMPTLKGVLIHTWARSSAFVKKAGTIILAGVVLVWFLSSMPSGVKYASEDTWIGHLGHFMAPIFKPAGFPFWQAAVALVFGILAKETVVGTMGTLYGVGEERLGAAIAHQFTPLSAVSFMVMSLLYIPCIASIGIIKGETNSWRWTGLAVGYSLLIGWFMAVLFYQFGRIFA